MVSVALAIVRLKNKKQNKTRQILHPEIMVVSPYHNVPLRLEPGLSNDQLAFRLFPSFDSSRMKNWRGAHLARPSRGGL